VVPPVPAGVLPLEDEQASKTQYEATPKEPMMERIFDEPPPARSACTAPAFDGARVPEFTGTQLPLEKSVAIHPVNDP
jgi:hypothetical protein